MGSTEAVQKVRVAQNSCPCLKTLYLLQRGQCSKCDYYQQVPAKPRSLLDKLTGKRDTTLADRLDHSQVLSLKRQEQRDQRLKLWKHENERRRVQDQQLINASRELEASQRTAVFERNLATLRAQEEVNNVPLEDHVIVYDEEALHSEMLSPINH